MNTLDPITEEWIKTKLKIETNNLEDVKSLSLPGTYQDKIIRLGNALQRFTRLKELDLSRNSISSLEGLENLKHLEKLNLYYNNVGNLSELDRLHRNKNLIELDLRLNPIVKEENDYRLYLISLLPTLRILDDREIKDGERQMAFNYFGNKNSLYDKKPNYDTPLLNNNATASRVKTVSNLMKRSAGIKDGDDGYKSDFSNLPTYFIGNDIKNDMKTIQPNFEQYSPRSLKKLGEVEFQTYAKLRNTDERAPINRRRSSSLQELSLNENDDNKNPQCDDEYDAYSKFKSKAMFTPSPSKKVHGVAQLEFVKTKNKKSQNENQNENEKSDDEDAEMKANFDEKGNPLFGLLNLVDRYWNGTRSLHKNFKFLGLANQLLSQHAKQTNESNNNYESQINALKTKIKSLQDDNRKLNEKIQIKDSNDPDSYSKAYANEIENLKKRLSIVQDENKRLRKEYNDLSEKLYKEYTLDSMENKNEIIEREVEVMRMKLKQYEQLQNLTEMLQESHKSLVTTNEHLLREINEQKQRISQPAIPYQYLNQNDQNDNRALPPTTNLIQRKSNDFKYNDQFSIFNRNVYAIAKQ